MEEHMCDKIGTDNFEAMCHSYEARNKARIKNQMYRFLNPSTPLPEPLDISKKSTLHPVLLDADTVGYVFDKGTTETRRNMVEVCKKWAAWFILTGPRSAFEYSGTLDRYETQDYVTRMEGDIIVDTYCKCREAHCIQEIETIHARRNEPHLEAETSSSSNSDPFY